MVAGGEGIAGALPIARRRTINFQVFRGRFRWIMTTFLVLRSGGRCSRRSARSSVASAFLVLPVPRRTTTSSRIFSAMPSSEGMVDGGGSAAPTTERLPPWNNPRVVQSAKKRKRSNNNSARFRQHVNPLARQYQQPTLLSDDWPADVFDDCSRPLHLDIGCGKGGFLLDLASQEGDDANGASATRFNYLGLEIRPLVAQYARERIAVHGLTGRLDFLGCNANVDLERLLRRYQRQYDAKAGEPLAALRRVTIQFPDPHFKSHHAKRRVVTPAVVTTLARFMPAGATVFLQSDVRSVLDDMRQRFRESALYFADSLEDAFDEYLPENILGVPTEREVSVLKKDLPVYRALFTRTSTFVPPGG